MYLMFKVLYLELAGHVAGDCLSCEIIDKHSEVSFLTALLSYKGLRKTRILGPEELAEFGYSWTVKLPCLCSQVSKFRSFHIGCSICN